MLPEYIFLVYTGILKYRKTNAIKYWKEKESDYSDYKKYEVYKNRVRLCDIVLPALVMYLKNEKKLNYDPELIEIP